VPCISVRPSLVNAGDEFDVAVPTALLHIVNDFIAGTLSNFSRRSKIQDCVSPTARSIGRT